MSNNNLNGGVGVYPSENPGVYEELNFYAHMIAVYTNPHLFPFDFGKEGMPDEERQAEIQSIKGLMAEIMG
jgi:hypothetical protein